MKKTMAKLACVAALVAPAVAMADLNFAGGTSADQVAISLTGIGTYTATIDFEWKEFVYKQSRNSSQVSVNDTNHTLDYYLTAGSSPTHLQAGTISDLNADTGNGKFTFANLTRGVNYVAHFSGTWRGREDIYSYSAPVVDLKEGTLQYSAVTAPVPEPETYAMMLAGLGMMTTIARRRRHKSS